MDSSTPSFLWVSSNETGVRRPPTLKEEKRAVKYDLVIYGITILSLIIPKYDSLPKSNPEHQSSKIVYPKRMQTK
jgi:hypothetical protein